MMDAVTEAVARALYARWCTNCDSDGWEPDWDAFEKGASLNGGGGLSAETFRNDAEAIAPFDENVGRRLCWHHCVAVAFHDACKSPEACVGLEDWQQRTVDAVMEAVRTYQSQPTTRGVDSPSDIKP